MSDEGRKDRLADEEIEDLEAPQGDQQHVVGGAGETAQSTVPQSRGRYQLRLDAARENLSSNP